MGKKGNDHKQKKKLTKKEQKAMNHLKLMNNKKSNNSTPGDFNKDKEYDKAA